MSEPQHDIALIGLAVMGQNLVLNMANHGHSVAVYNRTASTTEEFIASLPGEGVDKVHEGTVDRVKGYNDLGELCASLKSPRKVMIMVKAGPAVDAVIEAIKPHLDKGDVIIDGGNSYFVDTNRRYDELTKEGYLFVGAGVSGGEEGALKGPSIMPGGSKEAWPLVKPIMQDIAAKVGPNHDVPCCEWVGPAGSGHYVKMVHNGIEYGDMQLICESYFLMKEALGLSNDELYDVFASWNKGVLASYLIEITRDIFSAKDPETGEAMVDLILDVAKQKGTGKWMAQHALDLGVPTTLITEAVYARCLAAQKDERERAEKVLKGPDQTKFDGDRDAFIDAVGDALYASKLVSYAQGYVQMQAAAAEFGWDLAYGDIALMWRGGCIIRSVFLDDIKAAFDKNPQLENLLLDDFFKDAIDKSQSAWREVVQNGVRLGIPMPGFTAALSYYDGYRRSRLPANLLQAQRDYFGAHTYQRLDKPREETFHSEWLDLRKDPGEPAETPEKS
ncbi:decarboxylating NADP(+)-dependent phosphogluconate dehydrogenase [Alienimonas californiensis]|uniref:6-phosphogluconate dehydrogenase, decarboxylating n=1 Tax=Alienimonas californiensis TaxID=2527989 RepID=A0A517PF44_9PLAN|nr:decarboxylating NADP(+)-dependent phosphogluconate dehydrogenase [Alienimonas californiensis]QDT17982.1 6-phosphogluconate dehydrogenase, NADP(+)-dependent, decarboxylating [Alienimonas californiensis]